MGVLVDALSSFAKINVKVNGVSVKYCNNNFNEWG